MKITMFVSLVVVSMLTACGAEEPSHINSVTVGRGVSSDTFTVNLVQKKSPSASREAHVPPIPGVTRLILPLYPGAASTSRKPAMAFEETPISWYVRTGKADYVVPARASQLEGWYRKHMAGDGYHQTGTGSTGNVRTGTTAQGLVFQPVHQVTGHQVEVDLSFESLGDAKTQLEYWCTDVVLPKRPVANLVVANVIRVDGEMTVNGPKVTKYKVDITNPKEIQKLVSACNSVTKLIPGVNPGGPMIWGTADLTLHTSTGKSIPVEVDTDGLAVRGVGLQDSTGTVWKTLESIMGVHGLNRN